MAGTAVPLADFATGDSMTEAIFLDQDPRYFRRDATQLLGNCWKFCSSDDFERLLCEQPAVDATFRFGTKIGVDMAANVLKEFWPDLQRKRGRENGWNMAAK